MLVNTNVARTPTTQLCTDFRSKKKRFATESSSGLEELWSGVVARQLTGFYQNKRQNERKNTVQTAESWKKKRTVQKETHTANEKKGLLHTDRGRVTSVSTSHNVQKTYGEVAPGSNDTTPRKKNRLIEKRTT
jgi:hypothetical protein